MEMERRGKYERRPVIEGIATSCPGTGRMQKSYERRPVIEGIATYAKIIAVPFFPV